MNERVSGNSLASLLVGSVASLSKSPRCLEAIHEEARDKDEEGRDGGGRELGVLRQTTCTCFLQT